MCKVFFFSCIFSIESYVVSYGEGIIIPIFLMKKLTLTGVDELVRDLNASKQWILKF